MDSRSSTGSLQGKVRFFNQKEKVTNLYGSWGKSGTLHSPQLLLLYLVDQTPRHITLPLCSPDHI